MFLKPTSLQNLNTS